MTANQSVSTPNKAKEPPKKVNMNELRVAFNRVSIYDPMICCGCLCLVGTLR